MMLDKVHILSDVKRALAEDIGTGDISAALLSPQLMAEAEIVSREPMLVCGCPWVNAVFAEIDTSIVIEWLVQEGSWLDEATILCRIKGPAASILTAERTALNFLQTLSATATQTRRYLLKLQGTGTRLLDTRKTIPGLRMAQKYAVACAGGVNHRMGLYDAFLIKENHIKSCGSITTAIAKARQSHRNFFIEIEVETLDELQEALAAKPDRILLDNFSNAMLVEAVKINQHRCELEASGGIGLSTIRSVAETGVNYISVGSITKSIQAIDLSLLVREVK
ncbi:carboxylating nicotinate-nucleotide diphosphorylase [Legionella brunensis]|uniref:Probable nicotinate-nucleotide pyrophosphorylase [carboxylating] n=1 Tax=Legionella brunensis TaxID=29422 RepID=A0A0W0SDA0_9GAMM|nr:carboxylating nicotinate-nucleotide diphosphorylase [Legionella brunensis]KTC81383.1 nicotinate-nucleotide pyrophosphorylase [Legionella brunensis]